MNKFRTTKKIKTSLHDDNEYIVEFRYEYKRDFLAEGLYIEVKCYNVMEPINMLPDINNNFTITKERLVEIPGSESNRFLTNEKIRELCEVVSTFVPQVNDDSLTCIEKSDYALMGGIKVIITTEHLWKDQLTMDDFE